MAPVRRKRLAEACLLALVVPMTASAQWRINASGNAAVDAMRFDLPEQAHEYLRDYRVAEYSQTHQFVSDRLYPSESYSDGRLVSWLCLHRSDAPGNYDPQTCYAGALAGTKLTNFILPDDMSISPLLDRDLGRPTTELCVGNPINLGTGNKFQQETDYQSAGAEPLVFSRYYNSQLADEQRNVGLGVGWSHSFSHSIALDAAQHGENMVVLHRPEGQQLAFYRTNDVWLPTWNSDDRLYQNGGWRYERADGVTELYNTQGQLTSILYPSGNQITLSYANDELQSVVDSYGRSLGFTVEQGQITAVTDPSGQQYLYQFTDSTLSGVANPDTTSRTYHYEDAAYPGMLTGLTDERGNRFATWGYDSEGRAVLSEHSNGTDRTEVRYNADGSVTVTNALGHEQHYTFSRYNGQLKPDSIEGAACTGFAGGTKTFTYDGNGKLATTTDREGQKFTYQFNSRALEISRTSKDGGVITTEWHPEFPMPTKITEPALITEFTYDDHQRPLTKKLSERSGSGVRLWTFTYHPDSAGVPGQLATIDGPRTDVADITQFDYDAQGNLSRISNALGHVIEYSNHDEHGRPQTVTDANSIAYTLIYDALGRLSSSTGPKGTTTYSHNELGQITSVVMPGGLTFSYEYDAAQQLAAVIDQQGNRQELDRNALGDIEEQRLVDTAGVTQWQQYQDYTPNGWLSSVTNGTGNATSFGYDKIANLTSETDPAGNTYTYRYDGFSHVTQSIDPNNRSTAMRYDDSGSVTRVTDPRNRKTYYTYNGFGEVVTLQSPDTGTATYTYDEAGNMSTKTDTNGQTFTYGYDALNRMTSITVEGQPDADVTFSYDEPGAANGVGRLTSITDASGVSRYGYTASGELASEERGMDGRSLLTNYTYDGAGQLESIEYPSGRKATYQRNGAGEVIGVTLDNGGNSRTLVSDLIRKPFGPVTDLAHGNGLWDDRNYDLNYQLESVQVAGAMHRSYLYTANSNVDTITDGLNAGDSQTFSYDKLSRLIDAAGGYGTREYTYNYNGNRTAIYRDGVKDTYTVVFNSNRLTKKSIGSISYSYDANGNTIGRGTDIFGYDAFNRLSEATVNDETSTYSYNSAHQRVKKSAGGVDTLYVYGLGGELLAEVNAGTGQTQREYVWLDGQLVAYLVDGTVYHVHNDHLGTPQALTDELGEVVWKAQYTPFGRASVTTEQVTFNIRFPGQYFDAETGLHYNWHRYYDPSLGRYLQSDRLGLFDGVDTYGYLHGNPLLSIDPTGEYAWVAFGAFAGGAINAIAQYHAGQPFDIESFGTAVITGAAGGGLGTITKSLSWGKNLVANTIGSGLIGGGVTVAKNKISGSCDDVKAAAVNGLIAGGIGAGVGNATTTIISGINLKHYEKLPLEVKTFFESNAIHGVPKPTLIPGAVTLSNASSNTIANMTVYQGEQKR
ncbi:RHS repeat-associated core domain-containing protein [Vibrio parahaemolyticus]